MKVEYINDVDPDIPNQSIIRLMNFSPNEMVALSTMIRNLIFLKVDVILEQQEFISESNCSVTFQVSRKNLGFVRDGGEMKFICKLDAMRYSEMAEQIEFFEKEELQGFVWLYNIDSDIDFLLSEGGGW